MQRFIGVPGLLRDNQPKRAHDPLMSGRQCVFVASGEIEAQQVRTFLESAGIGTTIRGEALRKTHGLTVDGLGAVQIFVQDTDVEQAHALLDSAEAGRFRLSDDVETNG